MQLNFILVSTTLLLIITLFIFKTNANSLKRALSPLKPSEDYTHFLDVDEDEPNQFSVFWKYDNDEIEFEVHCKSKGWCGLGFSPNGGMKDSDIIIGWVDKSGKAHIQDCHVGETLRPIIDAKQDVHVIDAAEINDYTILKFKRKLSTCDNNDREIKEGTYYIIAAWNDDDPVTGNNDWKYHGPNRTTRTVDLLTFKEKSYEEQNTLPSDAFYYDMKMPNVTIPAKDTFYFCEIFELPKIESDVHLIQFEMMFNKDSKKFVHHLLAFECFDNFEPSQPLRRECGPVNIPFEFQSNCMSRLSFGWGVGGSKKYAFPPQAGYLMKPTSKPKYILLEMHYDNSQMLSNIVDNTAVRLYFTPTLRKHDLGILVLGSRLLEIPPYSSGIKFSSICYPKCTEQFIPDEGIYIISGLLHTHLAGKSVKTTLIRDGKEIKNIFNNPTYDFEYQNSIDIEPLKIMKGDALMTECIYNTKNRANFTSFGYGTHDEMCDVFVYYYPRLPDINQCQTYMPGSVLMKFYTALQNDNLISGFKLNESSSYWENEEYIHHYFKNLNFTPALTKRFEDLFGNSPQRRSLYCGTASHPDKLIKEENIEDYIPSEYYIEPDKCKQDNTTITQTTKPLMVLSTSSSNTLNSPFYFMSFLYLLVFYLF